VVSSAEFIDIGDPNEITGAEDRIDSNLPPGLTPVSTPAKGVIEYTDLPYTFAKRHGVLLERATSGELLLVHRPGVQLTALSEARRKAGQALVLDPISADDFDARRITRTRRFTRIHR